MIIFFFIYLSIIGSIVKIFSLENTNIDDRIINYNYINLTVIYLFLMLLLSN